MLSLLISGDKYNSGRLMKASSGKDVFCQFLHKFPILIYTYLLILYSTTTPQPTYADIAREAGFFTPKNEERNLNHHNVFSIIIYISPLAAN